MMRGGLLRAWKKHRLMRQQAAVYGHVAQAVRMEMGLLTTPQVQPRAFG